jgi:copper(I)-binding protein
VGVKAQSAMARGLGVLTLAIALALASPAQADDYRLGSLVVSDPWARASAGKAKTGAAYLRIDNRGRVVDRLIGAATPAAKKAHLHHTVMEAGIMRMRPVTGVDINPGQRTELKPGGLHMMLMDLKAPLEESDTVPLTLTFEKAGSIEVRVQVRKTGAVNPGPPSD